MNKQTARLLEQHFDTPFVAPSLDVLRVPLQKTGRKFKRLLESANGCHFFFF